MVNIFYVIESGDTTGFPLIGTENLNVEGKPLMTDEMFRLFAADVLGLMVRCCPDKKLELVWEEIPGFTDAEFNVT